jgi:hypothetical protein
MKTKAITAAALAVASASALAVGPGNLGTIDNTPISVGNTVPAGLLFDVYTFSLDDPGMLSGIASALNLPPALNLSPFSVVLQSAAFMVLGTDTNPADGYSFTGLASGNYTLTFVGFATGTLGGSYGGAILAQTAPIPEPETYALMLAGLGMVGFMAARRSRR